MPTSRHNELIQERADLRTEAAALFAGAGGRLTEAQRSRDDEIEASLTELDAEIEREERNRDRANATAAVAGVQGRRSGLIESIHDRREDEPWGARTGHAFGEFLQAVKNVSMNPVMRADEPRLKWEAALGAGEAGGADGGFLTTVDVAQGILERMYEVGQILGLVKHIPLSGTNNALELNAIDETSRATGSRFGGVQGYWTDEGGSVTATRPKFRKISLKLKKLAALGYATDELLGDAGALESVMNDAFAQELTFLAEDAIYEGTGGGQPLGILNAPATVSVAKETGQAAATILKENIDKMWSRMFARNRANGVWLVNQDVDTALESLSAVVGVGGVPVWLPAGGLAEAPNARLKGRPVIPVEYAATLGTVGDIVFWDPTQYVVIEKGGIQAASSMHVAFITDEMAFRVIYRIDGAPLWHSALTPFHGTSTLSPFISLATRA